MKETADYIKAIDRYRYISFDVFGTLILRNVKNQTDIFRLVERRATAESFDAEDFCTKRIAAENRAIENNKFDEITLEEIYTQIDYDDSLTKKRCMELEIEMEIAFSQSNPLFDELISYCILQGKKIIVISDMYLSKSVIGKILDKNDIRYDYLYVSSEQRVRKSSGKLYKYVLKDLGIAPDEMIHIGDNKISDWIRPKLFKIKSVWYNNNGVALHYHKKTETNELVNSIIISYLENNTRKWENSYFSVGFQVFGVLLYGFSQWLYDAIKTNRLSKIFFLSRDGYIIKKAFDLIYGTGKNESLSEYLYVSRRSLTVPRLAFSDNFHNMLDTVLYFKREETIHTFTNKLGIDLDEDTLCRLNNQYGEVMLRKNFFADRYDGLFAEIAPLIRNNAADELRSCLGYLNQNIREDRFAVVDIGWNGSMQMALEDLFRKSGRECEIFGYYLGLRHKKDRKIELKYAEGYTFDYRDEKRTVNPDLIDGFNGLIETFYTANHGSVKKYGAQETGFVPIQEKWEEVNWDLVSNLQMGALTFIEGIMPLLKAGNLIVTKDIAFEGINNLLTKPSMDDVMLFENVVFYDVYYEKLVKYKGFAYYFIHPRMLMNDFLTSNWKIGFLKKMIKFTFPMDKLFLAVLKFR